MSNTSADRLGIVTWVSTIRMTMANDPGRQLLEDQIQSSGFLFLEDYLDSILAGPKHDPIIALVKTPGRKKDAFKKIRVATAAAIKVEATMNMDVDDEDFDKENEVPAATTTTTTKPVTDESATSRLQSPRPSSLTHDEDYTTTPLPVDEVPRLQSPRPSSSTHDEDYTTLPVDEAPRFQSPKPSSSTHDEDYTTAPLPVDEAHAETIQQDQPMDTGVAQKSSVSEFTTIGPPSPLRKSMRVLTEPSLATAHALPATKPATIRSSWLVKAREAKGMEDYAKKLAARPAFAHHPTTNNKRKSGEMLGTQRESTPEHDDVGRTQKLTKITATSPVLSMLKEQNKHPFGPFQDATATVVDDETHGDVLSADDSDGMINKLKKTVAGFSARAGKSMGKSLGGAAATALAEARAAAEAKIAERNAADGRVVKSLQLAAAAAKKQQEEAEKKAGRLKEMEARRQQVLQKKADEDKAREEKKAKEENERWKREREKEDTTEKRALRQPGKKLTQLEDDLTKKRKIAETEKKTETKKPASKDKKDVPASKIGKFIPTSSQSGPNASAIPSKTVNQTIAAMAQSSTVKLINVSSDAKTALVAKGKGKTKETGEAVRPASQVMQSQMQSRYQAQLDDSRKAEILPPPTPTESIELPDIKSEYSDSEDEDRVRTFNPPNWAQSPELREALQSQSTVNPDDIFGAIRPLKMEELFKNRTSRFRARTSSANWAGTDELTAREEREYERRMGYKR